MTAEQLLIEIRKIDERKRMFSSKTIGIDTLVLMLRIKEVELMPLIHQLAEQKAILYSPAPSRSGSATVMVIKCADSF